MLLFQKPPKHHNPPNAPVFPQLSVGQTSNRGFLFPQSTVLDVHELESHR
jgi:hypothetical protein